MSNADDIQKQMTEAIVNGEWFDIVYHGGSNPGSRRRIVPIKLLGGGMLRARCYTSDAVKPFALAKIEIISGQRVDNTRVWHHKPAPLPFKDVRDVKDCYATQLEDLGWIVDLVSHAYGWQLCLIGRFKNGKLRKTPTHILTFDHTQFDLVAQEDGTLVHANLRARTRPWGYRSKTYKDPSIPVQDFLENAGVSA